MLAASASLPGREGKAFVVNYVGNRKGSGESLEDNRHRRSRWEETGLSKRVSASPRW